MDSNVDGGTICFVTLDPFNVDAELLSVALDNFADLLTFEMSSDNLDLIVFSDGHGPNTVLLPEVLR